MPLTLIHLYRKRAVDTSPLLPLARSIKVECSGNGGTAKPQSSGRKPPDS
jgi:hypothetical protein